MTLMTDVEATETVNLTGSLDGAGHTISSVEGVDYVISNTARLIEATAPATISNLKIDGKGHYSGKFGIRGIYTIGTGDITIDNVEIVNCTYAINACHNGKLAVVNSTLQGWNSYDKTVTEAHFENVKFIEGEFDNFRPYNNTVCLNCDFGDKVVIDLSQMVKDAVIKFVNCTVKNQPLTASDLTGLAADCSVIEIEGGYKVIRSVNTVATAEELMDLAEMVNAGENYFAGVTIKLDADIDLNNVEWKPIGSATADHGFMGNFDGNGYVIKNLNITNIAIDADGYSYAGFFGVTEGEPGKENYIKNLVIENVNIETTGHIASAAIAYPYYTTLENITVKGDVNIKGGNYTAGVLAYTRRCVNAKNIEILANDGSFIEGKATVGGVISDIQMNGGLKANYSNFKASGLSISGTQCVGGISGILCLQTLYGATVENKSMNERMNEFLKRNTLGPLELVGMSSWLCRECYI